MAQRSCPRTWTPSPDMDTNASALSDDAPALAAPVTPRALGASAERDPRRLVEDLVDAAVVFRAALCAEGQQPSDDGHTRRESRGGRTEIPRRPYPPRNSKALLVLYCVRAKACQPRQRFLVFPEIALQRFRTP